MAISVFPSGGASTDEGGTLVTSVVVTEAGSKVAVAVAAGLYSFTFYGTGTLNVYSWDTLTGVGGFLGLIDAATSGNADATLNVPSAVSGLAFSGASGTVVVRKFATSTATTITDSTANAAAISLPTSFNPYRAVKGGNRWVVTAGYESGTSTRSSAYSDDGLFWTAVKNLPTASYWIDITYGNGLFVALAGYSGNIGGSPTSFLATSPDGITWTQRSLPASLYWAGITFGDGKFVAVAGAGVSATTTGAYSTDGVTWTAMTMPTSVAWNDVEFGNGIFVAISGGTAFASSTDGINWTARTAATSGSPWRRVNWAGTRFVVTGGYNSVSQVSSNGTTWANGATFPNSASYDFYHADYVNGVLFVSSNSIAQISYSVNNGDSWSAASTSSQNYSSFIWTGSRFVAINMGNPASSAVASNPPTSWSALGTGANVNDGGMFYLNGRYFSLNRGASFIYSSTDATSWTTHMVTYSFNWSSLAYGNGIYILSVADGNQTSQYLTSPDLTTWTLRSFPTTQYWRRIVFGAGRFFAPAGTSGTPQNPYYSADGINWTVATGAASYSQVGVFGKNRFVFMPQHSNNLGSVSFNGIDWLQFKIPAVMEFTSVAFGNGVFVAIANTISTESPVMVSRDGFTWTKTAAAMAVHPNSQISFANGKFAFANGPDIFISSDGNAWSKVTLSGQSYYACAAGPQGAIFGNTSNSGYAKTGTAITIS